MRQYLIQIFIYRFIQILLFKFVLDSARDTFVIILDEKRTLVQVLQFGSVFLVQLSVLILTMKKKYLKRYARWFTRVKQDLNPVLGLGIGLIPVLIYFYYNYSYSGQYNGFSMQSLLLSANFFLLGALGEELIFRGFFYRFMINKNRKYIFWIILLQAFLFSYFHVSNPGINVVRFVNIFLAGMLLGFLAIRGFLYAVLFHFLWNFSQGYLLGLSVSGYNFTGSLNTIFDAYAWESNKYVIILLGTIVLVLSGVYFKKKKLLV